MQLSEHACIPDLIKLGAKEPFLDLKKKRELWMRAGLKGYLPSDIEGIGEVD